MSLVHRITRSLPRRCRLFLRRKRLQAFVARERAHGRNILLFHMAQAGQSAYILPILEQLQKQEAVSVFLVADDTVEIRDDRLGGQMGLAKPRVLRWSEEAALGAVDAFVSPTQWVTHAPNAKVRVCIFHGLPTKGITFLPELMQHFNTLFLLGPLQHNLYEDFAAQHPDIARQNTTFNVGYSKSDKLLSGGFSRQEVLAKLGLDPTRPVVLYAPAWDEGAALDMYGESVVERLLEVDANLIVKLHYMRYESKDGPCGANWFERLKRFEANPRFRHVGNQPLDPYLAASDVMVNDVSSASFEFMMLDKPVVFIDCPQFFKATLGHSMYVRGGEDVLHDIRANAGRSAGLVVPGPAQLPEAVRRSLSQPQEFSAQRQAVRKQLLYNPGKAAVVATETLLKLVGASVP